MMAAKPARVVKKKPETTDLEHPANAKIKLVRRMKILVAKFDRKKPKKGKENLDSTINIHGRQVPFRLDHDDEERTGCYAKITILAVDDPAEVNRLREYYQDRYEKLKISADEKNVKAHPNSKHAYKKRLTAAKQNLYHLKYSIQDDYKTNPDKLYFIYGIVGWSPDIDICCNVLGINSTCPFYYDPLTDSRKQGKFIQGMWIMCNPPFYLSEKYIQMLEKAFRDDPETRALLIVPEKLTLRWFKNLCKSKYWNLVS